MAGPITIAILGDNRGLRSSIGDSESKLGKLGSAAGKVGKVVGGGLLIAGAAVAGFAVTAVKSASDAQQSLGATETVFGKFADRVIKDSNRAATQFGLSANEYRENANLIGSLFRNQGVSTDQLAGKTKGMIKTAADLSATFGGTTTEAVGALGSAFKGEFDPLERYGISIKASTIAAELAARGQDKLTGAHLKAAQQQATSRLIMEQSSRAQGAFGRETGTLAHQQQVLGAQFDNIKAKVGTALLPILTRLGIVFTSQVMPAIERAIPPFLAFARQVSAQVAPVVNRLGATFRQIAPVVVSFATKIATNVRPIVVQLAKTFKNDVIPAFQKIAPPVIQLAGKLGQLSSKILGAVLPVVIKLAGFLIRNLVPVLAGVITRTAATVGAIIRFGGALVNGVKAAVDFLQGIKSKIGEALSFVGELPGKVKGAVSGAASWLLQAGKDVINGLISGIRSMASSLVSTITSYVIDKIPGPVRKALGIGSPSKVMRKIGKQIMQGLIGGVHGGGKALDKAMARITGILTKQLGKEKARRIVKGYRDELRQLDTLAGRYRNVTKSLGDARRKLAELKQLATDTRQGALDFANIAGVGGDAPTAGSIVQGMLERLEAIRAFKQNIAALTASGLNRASLAQLIAAGVEQGGEAAAALVAGGKTAVGEVNSLQDQIADAAGNLGTVAGEAMFKGGQAAAAQLVSGLEGKQDAIDKAARRLANKLNKAVRKQLGGAGGGDRRHGRVGVQNTHNRRQLDDNVPASGGGGRRRQTVTVKFSAEQMDQLQRGKQLRADIDAWDEQGGRRK